MGLLDRLGDIAIRAGHAVQAFSRMPPAVEGLPRKMVGQQHDPDSKTGQVLRSYEALLGRVTYDAGPNWTRYSSNPATGLSPAVITAALQQANNGYPWQWAELCEQVLERDAHLAGIDDSRRREVSGKPFRIQPFNETPVAAAVAAFVESTVRDIDALEQGIENLLGANGQGWSASETVWTHRPVRFVAPSGRAVTLPAIVPDTLEWIHPKHFYFDLRTDEPYLVYGGENHSLPPHKIVFHDATGTGLIERRGFMRQCVWLHAAKQWALRDWLVYAHLFGLPLVEGIYDGDISQQDDHRAAYEQILRNLGDGTPAIHPRDFEVKAQQPAQGGKSTDVHGALIGLANAEMSKRVQGETLTTEMGQNGSYGAADTHADTRHGIVQADARKLAKTLRRDLFRPIVELNLYGLAQALGAHPDEIRACVPWILWRIDRETSPEQRMRIYASAVNDLGLEVDEEGARDEFALARPRPGSQSLTGKAQQVSKGAALVGGLEASKGVEAPPEQPPVPAPKPTE